MSSLHFAIVAHWFYQFESYIPAIAVTVGSALLLGCGISSICSPCKEKDQIFHKQVF